MQVVLKVGRFPDGPFGALCYGSMYYLLIGPRLDRCLLGAVGPSLSLFLILVWSVQRRLFRGLLDWWCPLWGPLWYGLLAKVCFVPSVGPFLRLDFIGAFVMSFRHRGLFPYSFS